jgi:hypothetical protein
MKKTKNLLSAAATILLATTFTACSSDAFMNEAPQEEQEKVSLSVIASQEERTPSTRITYTEDGNTNVGMTLQWGAKEKLGTVHYDGTNAPTINAADVLTGQNEEAVASATFEGEVTASSGERMQGRYSFYYPTTALNSALTVSGNTVTLNTTGQKNKLSSHVSTAENLGKYDLMYTEELVDPKTGTVTLTHACALLRLVLPVPAEAKEIWYVRISAWEPVFAESVTLSFNKGGTGTTASGGTLVSTLETEVTGDVKGAARTITVYIMTPAVTNFDGLLCKVSVEDEDENIYSYVHNLSASGSNKDGGLNGGEVYTFKPASYLQLDRWAGSNIYWDGTKLDFEKNPYEMGKSTYQGVFFQWGSLTGVSPVGTDWSGSIPIYSNSGGQSTSATWSSIDRYTETTVDGDELPTDYDICYQLTNGAWRMPTKAELPTATATAVGTYGAITTTANEGTDNIRVGDLFNKQVYVPAAGNRDYSNGRLYPAGQNDMYWSNTAMNSVLVYVMQYGKIVTGMGGYKAAALPIRCIKN